MLFLLQLTYVKVTFFRLFVRKDASYLLSCGPAYIYMKKKADWLIQLPVGRWVQKEKEQNYVHTPYKYRGDMSE